MIKIKREKKKQRSYKAKEAELILETPREVVVKLVQENSVKNYELLIWLFNVSTPIATALWTAFFTINAEEKSLPLFFSSVAFSVFSLALLYFIVKNRKKTYSDSIRTSTKISDLIKNNPKTSSNI